MNEIFHIENSKSIYFEFIERLRQRFPDAINEADSHALAVVDPKTASAEQIWEVLWNKPLYANTRVSFARSKIALLAPLLGQPNVWRRMKKGSGEWAIEHSGKGLGVSTFKLHGSTASAAVANGIAPHRLYTIIGGAEALSKWEDASVIPLANLDTSDLETAVADLREDFGFGWGPITVLHFLTDLGSACKPDIHLVNTLRWLGHHRSLKGSLAPTIHKRPRILSLPDAADANAFVRRLVGAINGEILPTDLRRMDKLLMEMSRTGMLAVWPGPRSVVE